MDDITATRNQKILEKGAARCSLRKRKKECVFCNVIYYLLKLFNILKSLRFFSSCEVAVLLGHEMSELYKSVGVAPLIVVPRDHLDEAWVE